MPRLRFDSSHSPTWARTTADRDDALTFDPHASETCRAYLDRLEQASRSVRHAGYFAYDLGRCFESLPPPPPASVPIPDAVFVECHGTPRALPEAHTAIHPAAPPASNFTKPEYLAAVRRCINYIAAGDVFQINLAQQLRVRTNETPSTIYRRLRLSSPGHYDALLEFNNYAILSNSPELFLKIERQPDGRRRILNRPIKGTRPNAPGMADELRDSAKDQAELAMIVDLQRNDLGRICEIGSVRVTTARQIETHAAVVHGVATIEGVLRRDVTLYDVLRATFPCGSVTGCPKIRAMQIIDEIEPTARGVYCGAIGWIENGEMEFSVAIRTMTLTSTRANGIAHIPVGGGIVADSDPFAEFDETLVKARAMLQALGVES